MLYEIIFLNKIHKTNEFVRVKPRITEDDRLVYILTDYMKLGGILQKYLPYKGEYAPSTDDLNDFFNFSEEEVIDILECNKC